MRIGFFGPRSVEPLHPRLMAFKKYFDERGDETRFIYFPQSEGLSARLNWFSLWFFDLVAIDKAKPLVTEFDLVFICDLKFLPLAKYATKKKIFTVYETIDHNVELRMYQLKQKLPWSKLFEKQIVSFFRKYEKKVANRCDAITVNSNSLNKYLGAKASVLFYSSPFENFSIVNNPNLPSALLYLGIFSQDKGSKEIISLSNRLKIPLFIYGSIIDKSTAHEIEDMSHITVTHKLSITELKKEIEHLMDRYYLFGLSLIKPVHYSYEVQEANKDIDYLALGTPIIGNTRAATFEKIEAGCGILLSHSEIQKIIHNKEEKEKMSIASRRLYKERYHSTHFKRILDKIIPF